MAGFPGFVQRFNIQGAVILAALSLALVYIVTNVLQQLHVIGSTVKVGMGFTLLAIVLAVGLVYSIGIGNGFHFSRADLIPMVIVLALVVGAVFFLPKVLPQMYSIGAVQLQYGVQSIMGITPP